MRTTITLDDDVHEFAAYYARARGITLSAAIDELIRKAEKRARARAELSSHVRMVCRCSLPPEERSRPKW